MERYKIHVTDSIIMDFIVDFCDILVMFPMALFLCEDVVSPIWEYPYNDEMTIFIFIMEIPIPGKNVFILSRGIVVFLRMHAIWYDPNSYWYSWALPVLFWMTSHCHDIIVILQQVYWFLPTTIQNWYHSEFQRIYLCFSLPGIERCQCLNGGFCPNPQNPRVCECRDGFYGTLCESGKYHNS